MKLAFGQKCKRTHYLSIPLALPYLCINVEILNVKLFKNNPLMLKKEYNAMFQFSKLLYATFSCKTSSNPTSMKKYNEMFNTETFELDWERIFSLPFKITLNTKLREFQYKILHRICYTNILLFKFGLADLLYVISVIKNWRH